MLKHDDQPMLWSKVKIQGPTSVVFTTFLSQRGKYLKIITITIVSSLKHILKSFCLNLLLSQWAEIILNKISNTIHKTYTWLISMLQGF